MIYSMTGFSKVDFMLNNKHFSAEIRAVNSKSIDINLKIANLFRAKELEIKNLLTKDLERGKVDVYIYKNNTENNRSISLQKEAIQHYIKEIESLGPHYNDPYKNLEIAMRLPDVYSQTEEELSEEEWNIFLIEYKKLIEDFNHFRTTEGKSLFNACKQNIDIITKYLKEIESLETERKFKVEEKLQKLVKDAQVNYDEQRFHQELLFYIEKLDISEEKVRLNQHCNYFIEILHEQNIQKGKKLGFISQEIGREINTIGSKANHAEMQKIVVLMKDSLEKIKEQVFNVL